MAEAAADGPSVEFADDTRGSVVVAVELEAVEAGDTDDAVVDGDAVIHELLISGLLHTNPSFPWTFCYSQG